MKTMTILKSLLFASLAAFAFNGAAQAADSSVSGEWDLSVETSAGTGAPHFSLKQAGSAVTGTYKGQFGEAPVSGTVKGNELSLVVTISAQGQEIRIDYTGVVDGNSIKGKVSLGELGAGTFTGKKTG